MKKILLVDDSNTTLMAELMLLADTPYAISVASSGEDAIAKARTARPDLILMDAAMPRMSGYEACKRLRQSDATRDTPILIVTTSRDAGEGDGRADCGCNDYVTKPFKGPELLAKVREYLGE